jgi:DNA end-binding protein Ku
MASTVWKGYFSFGLISVPIKLYVAARESHVSFHQIHASCGTRVKQQLYCPHDERVVERSELAKGYPIEGGGNVQITEADLRSLEPESSETMEVLQFVKLDEVDPLYFETSYYTATETAGERAYTLIFQSMQHLKLGAIAKITMHQREQIAMLRPWDKGLVLHTLFYPAEVREVAEYGQQTGVKVQKAEVELAEQFMKQLTAKFDPEQYKDEYQTRVEELVESKVAGADIEVEKPHRKAPAKVIDLMEALKESMARHAAEDTEKKSAQARTLEMPAKKPPQKAAGGQRKRSAG